MLFLTVQSHFLKSGIVYRSILYEKIASQVICQIKQLEIKILQKRRVFKTFKHYNVNNWEQRIL